LWIFQIENCREGVERQAELTRHKIYSSAVATVAHCELAAVIRVMEQGAVTVMEKPLTRPRVQQALQKALFVVQRERELQRTYEDFATKNQALTNRQRSVLAGVVNGKPTKLIAAELDVSIRLVELERAHLIRAFEVDSNAELAQRYGEYVILKRLRTVSPPAPHVDFAGLRRKLGKLQSR
jgi:two-component system, LuxR family, response regulator FixJ